MNESKNKSIIENGDPKALYDLTEDELEFLMTDIWLYFLKKPAGSESSRIIIADCTASDVFVSSLERIIELTLLIICDESDTQIIHIAMLISALAFPLESTGPVSSLVTRGMISPTSDTASVEATIMIMSLSETQLFIYTSRSGMPSFFCGSGR